MGAETEAPAWLTFLSLVTPIHTHVLEQKLWYSEGKDDGQFVSTVSANKAGCAAVGGLENHEETTSGAKT